MSRIPQKILPILQRVLLINHDWPCETGILANISNLSLQALEEILSKLHPVLTLKQRRRGSDGWGSTSIFFYHASFMEFVVDQARSKYLCIVNQVHWNMIVARSLRLLNGMHKVNGIGYAEKAPRLRKLLSAIPNTKSACVAELLFLRDQLYNILCRQAFAWCMYADLSDREVVAELRLVDFTMLRMLKPSCTLSSDLADRFPEEIRLRSMCCVTPTSPREQTKIVTAEDPPSPLAKADEIWRYLSACFDLLISDTTTPRKFETRFATLLYKTLTSGHLRRSDFNYLYSQINQYLLIRTQEWAKAANSDIDQINSEFAVDYAIKWRRYARVVRHVELIWLHWDPGFFQGPDEVKSKDASGMVRSAMLYWKTNILTQKQIGNLTFTKFLLGLIDQKRNGDLANESLVYVFVQSLVILGCETVPPYEIENFRNPEVYEQYFEDEFLRVTRNYHTADAQTFLSENTLLTYLEHVEDRLLLESRIIGQILPSERHPVYIKECKKSLIENHLQLIYREFEKLLGVDKPEEHLGRIYSLASQVEATKKLRTIFAGHVKQVVSASMSRILNQTRDKSLSEPQGVIVSTLLTIHSQYSDLVQGVFKDDEEFRKCLDQVSGKLCDEHPLIGHVLCKYIQATKLEEGHHDEPQNIAEGSDHHEKTSNPLPKHLTASTATIRSHESLSYTEPTAAGASTTSNSDVIENHDAQMAPKAHTEDERGDVAVQDGKLEATPRDPALPPVSVHQTSGSRKRALSRRF
ncbi:hypothetical protein D9756_009462 [Leucocoprinus leucothites]|uniref:Cullin N-terminal domain-containing protein n=1 Tax=Leucocoprinus leucothites TaxID=201217 RepID=A0A8H5CWZ7_9AGAR|nr:hypothetical protein D9756_009462 [Leucoagaricus leucothites]